MIPGEIWLLFIGASAWSQCNQVSRASGIDFCFTRYLWYFCLQDYTIPSRAVNEQMVTIET
jgi:hypothetical protein